MKTSLLKLVVTNNDIELQKNLVCFHIKLLFIRGSYTVYKDVLESRHIGRAFRLVNPKHEDRASVRNGDSLGLN